MIIYVWIRNIKEWRWLTRIIDITIIILDIINITIVMRRIISNWLFITVNTIWIILIIIRLILFHSNISFN